MVPILRRGVSILAVAAAAFSLGACASETPTTPVNWNYPGDQPPTASTKPLMRLAALPVNPAPPAPYADYSDEPTRFLFHPRPVIVDQDADAASDEAATDADQDTGEE